MTITKRLVQTGGLLAGAIGAVAVAAPESAVGRTARHVYPIASAATCATP